MKITKKKLRQIIQQEHMAVLNEGRPISYNDVRKEYDVVLDFLKQDLLKRVGSKYIADALELLSNDVRDGVHTPKSGTAWDEEDVQNESRIVEFAGADSEQALNSALDGYVEEYMMKMGVDPGDEQHRQRVRKIVLDKVSSRLDAFLGEGKK